MNDIKVILSQVKSAGAVGFGIPLILAGLQETEVPYAVCSDLDGVKALFDGESPVYRAAQRILMQNDAPVAVAVCASSKTAAEALDGIFDNDWRQLVVVSLGQSRVTPGTPAVEGVRAVYEAAVTAGATPLAAGDTVTLCGQVYTMAEGEESFEQQMARCIGQFNASSEAFTAQFADGKLTFTARTVGAVSEPPTAAIAGKGYGVAEVRMVTSGKDPAPEAPGETVMESTPAEIAAYLEARGDKLFFLSVSGVEGLEGLKTLSRTVAFYHPIDRDNPVCALVGAAAGKRVGSFTYKNLLLKGVEPVRLSGPEVSAVHDAGAITVLKKAGDVVSSEGKATNGEYIDLIDTQDYIIRDLVYREQKLLNAADKIPYDNNGIAQLEAVAVTVLQEAFGAGMIAVDDEGLPDFDVTFQKRSETPAGDRAERRYLGGRFRFGLAGAVHTAEIRGEIII